MGTISGVQVSAMYFLYFTKEWNPICQCDLGFSYHCKRGWSWVWCKQPFRAAMVLGSFSIGLDVIFFFLKLNPFVDASLERGWYLSLLSPLVKNWLFGHITTHQTSCVTLANINMASGYGGELWYRQETTVVHGNQFAINYIIGFNMNNHLLFYKCF